MRLLKPNSMYKYQVVIFLFKVQSFGNLDELHVLLSLQKLQKVVKGRGAEYRKCAVFVLTHRRFCRT